MLPAILLPGLEDFFYRPDADAGLRVSRRRHGADLVKFRLSNRSDRHVRAGFIPLFLHSAKNKRRSSHVAALDRLHVFLRPGWRRDLIPQAKVVLRQQQRVRRPPEDLPAIMLPGSVDVRINQAGCERPPREALLEHAIDWLGQLVPTHRVADDFNRLAILTPYLQLASLEQQLPLFLLRLHSRFHLLRRRRACLPRSY